MRHNPKHAEPDEAVVRTLIAENPWATLVSQHGGELVASHYPILLDDTREQLTTSPTSAVPTTASTGSAARMSSC